MKKQKRILVMIFCMILIISNITGCSSNHKKDLDKISIVCTTFSQYDWIKEILGENVDDFDILYLGKSGGDMHNYQPSADDILMISTCDLFVYNGGESEKWINDILRQSTNEEMITFNMMQVLDGKLKGEEIVEGMQSDHTHEDAHEHEDEHEDEEAHEDSHEHEDEHEEGHADEPEEDYDEHIWLSLENAVILVGHLRDCITKIDQNNKNIYETNAQNYIENLENLHTEYSEKLSQKEKKTLLFGDRFPFIYMMDEYDIEYYAAFPGCSAETEASFETIIFLAEKVNELNLQYVLVIDGSNKDIANSIINNTAGKDQEIKTLNSMQSVTSVDIENGANYIAIMQQNLETIENALDIR